jgi:predicted nucleic acid-binding Zn finger protein
MYGNTLNKELIISILSNYIISKGNFKGFRDSRCKMSLRKKESSVLYEICAELDSKGKISKNENIKSLQIFGNRFKEAINLVNKRRVKRYIFKPSKRAIWIVHGRMKEYQIFPETNFCSCDDYYFRVMKSEKELCYHLIAQKIAEALDKYDSEELSDKDYSLITKKFRVT